MCPLSSEVNSLAINQAVTLRCYTVTSLGGGDTVSEKRFSLDFFLSVVQFDLVARLDVLFRVRSRFKLE